MDGLWRALALGFVPALILRTVGEVLLNEFVEALRYQLENLPTDEQMSDLIRDGWPG